MNGVVPVLLARSFEVLEATMAAQAQANAITLRGSTDIVADFFGNVLYV